MSADPAIVMLWEKVLCDAGLSMGRGITNNIRYVLDAYSEFGRTRNTKFEYADTVKLVSADMARYYLRQSQGLCGKCGGMLDDKKKACRKCNRKNFGWVKTLHAKWRAMGVCVDCGEPTGDGSIRYCSSHLKAHRERMRRYMRQRRAKNQSKTMAA